MLFKGISIRFDFDVKREYPVTQLYSFFKNNCKYFDEDNNNQTIEQNLDVLVNLLKLINLAESNRWENEYLEYLKSKYPY